MSAGLVGSRRLLAALGVEPAEGRSVALMTAHAFFMGCGTAFFETAASATFLARFAPSYLPWVYVAAAGVNTLTGAVYSRAQARVTFARLMSGTLWFLLALTLSARVGLALSSLPWIAFGALVAYRIISSLTDLEYWAVASRMYDVRQAKRLFGLIGTGEVIARIAASFSVPFLVKLVGVSNLMLLSAGALGLCVLLLRAVLARIPDTSGAGSKTGKQTTRGSLRTFVTEILENPYLRLVVSVAVLATFGKYFVDFAFLEQMSSRVSGEAEVAKILGIFGGLTQTLSLLTRLFISRPLLHRFGVRIGVLLLPALQVLCTLGILISGVIGLGDGVIFAFVLANQGVYKTFKHPIDNASFKVLYQPLKPEQRLAAQIAVEVLFAPVVVGVSGLVMLLFTVAIPYEPVRFAFVLFATFLAWTFAARAAGRRYSDKLRAMLRLRFDGSDVEGAPTARAAVDGVADAEDAVARLDELRIPKLAQSATLALARRGDGVLPLLAANIQSDADRQLLLRLVDVHRALGTPAAVAQLARYLEFPDVSVRTRLLAALGTLRYEAKGTARGQVNQQLRIEVKEIAWTLAAYNDLGAGDLANADVDLRGALEEDRVLAVGRMFNLLAFVYEAVAIRRAAAHVAHPSKDMRAYARELLEVTLDAEDRKLFLPLLDDLDPRERLQRIEKRFPQPKLSIDKRLLDIIERPARSLRSWTRALAIRAASARRVDGLDAAFQRLPPNDPVIEEARSYLNRSSITAASHFPGKESSTMGLIDDVLILKRVPMFSRTSEAVLVEIASSLELVEVPAKTSIFEKGDAGDSMYIVVRGRVRVFDGDETLGEMGEHEIVGELALLDPAPRSASVVTLEDTLLFRLDAETFSQLMASNVDIVRGVLRVLCERLRRTTQLAVEQT